MCAGSNGRNGYRERKPTTCVSTLTLRVPKPRQGSLFPEDAPTRHQRTDRALVAAVAEMYATGTSTRKAQKTASEMGIEHLSKGQVGAVARDLGADVHELLCRKLAGVRTPYLW